jgi:hypothetical protein
MPQFSSIARALFSAHVTAKREPVKAVTWFMVYLVMTMTRKLG